ncbi:DUF3016 domain-containing protein [Thermomonas brevis]
MHRLRILPLLAALALGATACASTGPTGMLAPDAPRALAAQGPVSVAWADPAGFTELRFSGNRWAAARGDWLQDLAEHMRTRGEQVLPAGHRLDITILDLARAGQYEPWRGAQMDEVRIVRDLHPPRMTVQFRHLDAAGNVVAEGERRLTDPAFLTNASPLNSNDPLRFEKRMIDSWLRREFRDNTAAR